jgi:3-oxoacyl-[acyl-carrier protein] reductase
MNIHGSTIVITGSGQGLGRSMAVEMAKKGAKIAVVDMNEEAMQETLRVIHLFGGQARTYQCNVADESSVVDTFNAIAADFGSIHGLINSAGV